MVNISTHESRTEMSKQTINGYDSNGDFVIENNPYIEDPWTVIESYFKDHHLDRLVRHQLESYNNFVGYQIIKTIEMFNPVHIKSEDDFDAKSGKYSLELFVTFENFNIYRPQIHENNGAIKLMFPQEARLRNFTYASAMTLDLNIKYVIRSGENLDNVKTLYKTLPKIHIGKLPIMLKSNICVLNQYKHVDNKHAGECKYDTGGYFIINGSEKTVLAQERAAENRVYCFNVSKNDTKYTWKAEIKSVPDFKCISPKQINMMVSSKNNGFGFPICLQIPRIKQPIPLFIAFRALNVISDKEICEYILLDISLEKHKHMLENLQASIIEANNCLTNEDAIKYIVSNVGYTPMNTDKETGALRKKQFAMDVLQNDLFPHCQTLKQKVYFLGYMANKLLQASFEWIKADDRDSYLNKRIDLTGTSLNNLFRNHFNKLVKDMNTQVVKEIKTGSWQSKEDYLNIINLTNVYKIIKSNTIENGFKRALSTGDFGINQANSTKVGVAQVLNRLTYIASLSHLRRVSTPTDKSGKLIPPRKLHSTSWGFICPAETPEGASVGVVKNMSYMAHITIHSNSNSIYDYVLPKIVKIDDDSLTPKAMYNAVKIFVNGAWVGISLNPEELYAELKEMKYKGIINIYTSIVFDYKMQEIRVCNDSGRITRPVLRVKNNNILLTRDIMHGLKEGKFVWDDLLTSCKINDAVIEYIDPEEQGFSMIATKPKDIITSNNHFVSKYTHCEIHPSTIFGVVASCIPYPDHNQSPRNTYQCLDVNETVMLTNGASVPIKDVKLGDEVVCFNPDTLNVSYTKVVNQYVRETDKMVFKLRTISGKEIVATHDHNFMTLEGWKSVIDFVPNETFIGMMPSQTELTIELDSNDDIILDEISFRNMFIEMGVDLKYINSQITNLIQANIFPLRRNDYRLPIIARIFGYTLSDGSINIYYKQSIYMSCSYTFETEHDVIQFENDVSECGFNKCKYNYASRECNGTIHSTYNVTHNGELASLLIALGISYGKKTETMRKCIPDWIMNGNKLIKREFVSGFQGGDGCKIRWNNQITHYNFICAETSQQIVSIFRDSLTYFMEQIVILLNEFDIEAKMASSIIVTEDRVKVAYKLSDKQTNLIKYFENIGYRYAFTKNTESFIVIEYLKFKELHFKEHKQFIKKIQKMIDDNMSNSRIASELEVATNYVADVRRSYDNNRKICMPNLKDNTIENWLQKVKVINGMLFVPIVSIQQVDTVMVSDITVESDNHSFVTSGGILSSNCAQAKQAMGIYATNFNERMDKTAYVLSYPTRPLVDTRVMNIIKLQENPSGCNINVAIMTHTGYNQEDSLLVNKGSIDRGLLQITITHTEKDEDKQKINGDEEIRGKPDPAKTKRMKIGNYGKVGKNGVIPENELVENHDIIIAKMMPIKENRNDHTKLIKYEDCSKQYKTDEETFVDKNYIDRNGDGYSFAKVRLRSLRKPVIGDKFSSRHGQKGTVGNIIPEEDMPFTRDGVRPDIIINPHAIPSRMTIGQLKETLLGKVLVQLGLFGDGTSFGDLGVEEISQKLLNLGYEAHGNELFYSGLSGEQIECSVFFGPVFYQRLKHMVNDKQHSRSIGPMMNLTRQPGEGRSNGGGLRFGEMERDCMVSHGAARFTRGRMYDASDKYQVHVCKKCGLIASYNDKLHIHLCKTCDNRVDFAYVEIPYACKLLFQELATMNVVPRLITEK